MELNRSCCLSCKLDPLLPYSSKPLQRNGFDEGAALPLFSPVVPLTVGC